MSRDDLAERRFLVHGMGITNTAVARALVRRGRSVVLTDDGDAVRLAALAEQVSDAAVDGAAVQVVPTPTASELEDLVPTVDAVVPTPGLPERHPVFAAARAGGSRC